MQQLEHQPRLGNLDLDLMQRVLGSHQQSRADDLEDERSGQIKRLQTHYGFAFDDARAIGLFLYALGYPLDEVRSYLTEAARYMRKVFELRGTQGPFPVTVVTTDEKGRVVTQEPLHPPDHVDYSQPNAADGLQGIYLALFAGDLDLARSIAEMLWDPPDAEYIHSGSEVCTPDQQHLAYAVKHLLLGEPETCLKELSRVDSRTATVDVQRQAEMVRAIARQQPDVFLRSLQALVDWHAKTAPRMIKRKHPDYSEYFLSIPGLGLVALAKVQGVIEEVPISSVYLPLGLVAAN